MEEVFPELVETLKDRTSKIASSMKGERRI